MTNNLSTRNVQDCAAIFGNRLLESWPRNTHVVLSRDMPFDGGPFDKMSTDELSFFSLNAAALINIFFLCVCVFVSV
jgi:hypothetical protein